MPRLFFLNRFLPLALALACVACQPQEQDAAANTTAASPAAAPARRTGGAALAAARQCLACHHREQKRVGPSFLQIRARFLDDAAAIATLAHSIRQGGRGRWGVIPMPAQPQLSQAEAEVLAAWILQFEP